MIRPPLGKLRLSELLHERAGDRSMTYISALRSVDGLVMCADTQESWGDYKNYVEKLRIVRDRRYPLAIGGAGIGDLLDALMQEVVERAAKSQPRTVAKLRALLETSVQTVYRDDLPWLVVKKQERTPQFLVCAKPSHDDYCIFKIQGKRISEVKEHAIIGYATPANNNLLSRLYRRDLSMQQAVMLALYLVSLSKKLDEGVGGENSAIAIVTDDGVWADDPEYTRGFEKFIDNFRTLTDSLFLTSLDMSIPPDSVFPVKLKEFGDAISILRDQAFRYSAEYIANSSRSRDAQYHRKDAPYPKFFPGASIESGTDGTLQVREMTKNEQEQVFASMEFEGGKFIRVKRARNGLYSLVPISRFEEAVRGLTRQEVIEHLAGTEVYGEPIEDVLALVDQCSSYYIHSRPARSRSGRAKRKGRGWFLVPKRSRTQK